MKKTILAVTGCRSEYGLLLPVLKKIEQSKKLKLSLIVSGAHLLREYGDTADLIRADGFEFGSVPMYDATTKNSFDYAFSFAKGVKGFAEAIKKYKPWCLLVLGDRLEAFAATVAASIMELPIAHIHGGDTSDCGQIDDSIRHSISKFAQIHFAASKESAERLKKMGEEPKRIFRVGSPCLDSVVRLNLISKKDLCQTLKLDRNQRILVCLQHSVIVEKSASAKQMRETMLAIKKLNLQTAVIYPNNDIGSSDVINVIRSFENLNNVKIFKNLSHLQFISLLNAADVMIGNSSSGMIEAPYFNLPNVSIGTRQAGREHSNNVIFANYNKNEIIKAVNKALHNAKFQNNLKKCKSPYGQGNASEKIVKVLEKIEINEEFMRKRITY